MTPKQTRIVYLIRLSDGRWGFAWRPEDIPNTLMWKEDTWESKQEAQIQAELRFEDNAVIFEEAEETNEGLVETLNRKER